MFESGLYMDDVNWPSNSFICSFLQFQKITLRFPVLIQLSATTMLNDIKGVMVGFDNMNYCTFNIIMQTNSVRTLYLTSLWIHSFLSDNQNYLFMHFPLSCSLLSCCEETRWARLLLKIKFIILVLLVVSKGSIIIIIEGSMKTAMVLESITSWSTGIRQKDSVPGMCFRKFQTHPLWHMSSNNVTPPNFFLKIH